MFGTFALKQEKTELEFLQDEIDVVERQIEVKKQARQEQVAVVVAREKLDNLRKELSNI